MHYIRLVWIGLDRADSNELGQAGTYTETPPGWPRIEGHIESRLQRNESWNVSPSKKDDGHNEGRNGRNEVCNGAWKLLEHWKTDVGTGLLAIGWRQRNWPRAFVGPRRSGLPPTDNPPCQSCTVCSTWSDNWRDDGWAQNTTVELRTKAQDGSCLRWSRGQPAVAPEDEMGDKLYTWEVWRHDMRPSDN